MVSERSYKSQKQTNSDCLQPTCDGFQHKIIQGLFQVAVLEVKSMHQQRFCCVICMRFKRCRLDAGKREVMIDVVPGLLAADELP